MRRLTVYEHDTLKVAPGGRLRRSDFLALVENAPMLPGGAFSLGHEAVRFGSYCGLIRCGDLIIEILPKIYRADEAEPNRGLMACMLATCFDLPIHVTGDAQTGTADDLLDIIILAFVDEAERQLRRGMLREYTEVEADLARPRGRLLAARQARRGRAGATSLACVFDELTGDNRVNRCLKAALRAVPSSRLRRTISPSRVLKLETILAEVTHARMTANEVGSVPLNRLSRRYADALELARWLLRIAAPDVFGHSDGGLALLFDMNQLFERFVALHLRMEIGRQPQEDRLRLSTQGPRRRLLRNANGRGDFDLLPDLSLWQNEQAIAVLDTKWKRLRPPEDNKRPGIVPSDIYQVLAYAHAYRTTHVDLIYPRSTWTAGWSGADWFADTLDGRDVTVGVRLFDIDDPEASARALLESCKA